jgi:hypothetical protein
VVAQNVAGADDHEWVQSGIIDTSSTRRRAKQIDRFYMLSKE